MEREVTGGIRPYRRLTKPRRLEKRVLELLVDGDQEFRWLCQKLQASPTEVGKACSRLVQQGRVILAIPGHAEVYHYVPGALLRWIIEHEA